jgi:hypothetical protein
MVAGPVSYLLESYKLAPLSTIGQDRVQHWLAWGPVTVPRMWVSMHGGAQRANRPTAHEKSEYKAGAVRPVAAAFR